jgi:hypothetical protein
VKKIAITQPKLTDLDRPFWLALRPLYVSQLRARLNFGSALLRLHRHGSGSFLMSSVTPPFSTFCPLPNRYGPRKRPLEAMGNFTRAASPDERLRLILGIQRYPDLGSLEGPQIRTFNGPRNGSVRQSNGGSIRFPRRQASLNLCGGRARLVS